MQRTEPLTTLSAVQRRLLDSYQRDMPITVRPFAAMASWLGISEAAVIDALQDLEGRGLIDRIGPVFKPGRVGASTLAAMAVPPESLWKVADIVSSFDEVNHNYHREHEFNLWFVITAPEQAQVLAVLDRIRVASGLEVLDLPLEHAYHIDLGFSL